MSNPLYSLAEAIMSSGRSRMLGIITLFLLAAAIPLTVFVAQQQQETRQRAQDFACLSDCDEQTARCNLSCNNEKNAAITRARDSYIFLNCSGECGDGNDICRRQCGEDDSACLSHCDEQTTQCNTMCLNEAIAKADDIWFNCSGECGDGNDICRRQCGSGSQQCGYDQTSRQYACSGGFRCFEDFFKDQSTGCQWQYKDPHFHCDADSRCTGGGAPPPPVGGQPPDDQPPPSGPTCEFEGKTYNLSEKRYECNNPKIQGPCADNAGVGVPFVCEESGWSNFNPYGECTTACKPEPSPPPSTDNRCRNNPVDPPSGYMWKADCSRTCDSPCPKNDFDPDNVDPEDSAWCYGFGSGSGEEARCMMLVRPNVCQKASDPGCRAPTSTPTPTRRQRDRDRDRQRDRGRRPTNTPTRPPGTTATPTIIACSTTSQCPTGFICIPDRCVPISPTPIGGSPTPTPTPTKQLGDTIIEVVIKLEGIGTTENNNPLHPLRSFILQLFDSNNKLVAEKSGEMHYNTKPGTTVGFFFGEVNMGKIRPGEYIVKVKTSGFLRKRMESILPVFNDGTTNIAPLLKMTPGDINNDNKIDIVDYNILVGCFEEKSGTSSCTNREGSDLDDDGDVDGVDYNLFIRSLAVKQGD